MVVGQCLTPDRHRERGIELLGFLKFAPRSRIFKAVQQQQAPLEGRLGAAAAGICKVHNPELTLNKMKLGMMLGTRVARGHWLDGDYGENEGKRGTHASGQVPHSSSS